MQNSLPSGSAKRDPATAVRTNEVANMGGTQGQESGHFFLARAVDRAKVEVHSVLQAFGVGDGYEEEDFGARAAMAAAVEPGAPPP